MRQSISCPRCGAKVREDRARCPRCRAVLAPVVDPAAVARSSRRLVQVGGAIAVVFAVIVTGLWITSPPAERPVPARPAADPLASRRPKPATAATAEAVPRPDPEPTFLEPAAAATLAYAAGDLASSLKQLQDAVGKNPQDAESWSNLGQVLVKMERVEEALPAFDRAIALLPSRWAYRFNQARALGLLGRLDESIAGYRTAQALFPDDYATAFNLAISLHKAGDEAGALEEYKKATAFNPEDASFHVAVAQTYERLQKPAEAAAAYGEALKLSPAPADADKLRARIAQLTGQAAPQAATTPGA